MSGRHVYLSSAFADFQTPEDFLELVRQVGEIVLDPATVASNPTGARYIYTPPLHPFDPAPRLCGLTGSWAVDGLVFCNPRYGRFLRGPIRPKAPVFKEGVLVGFGTGWVRKMCEHGGEGLYLVPARPDTGWWRELHAWCDWSLFWSAKKKSRIHFYDPRIGKVAHGSNLPSSVFYRGPRAARFCAVFGAHGTLCPGARTLQMLQGLHCDSA